MLSRKVKKQKLNEEYSEHNKEAVNSFDRCMAKGFLPPQCERKAYQENEPTETEGDGPFDNIIFGDFN